MIGKLAIFLVAILVLCACSADGTIDEQNMDYRQAMRQWIMDISATAKEINPRFLIIPQNCSPLFTDTGYADGQIHTDFLDSIDGAGQEGICFGNDRYNVARDKQSKEHITDMLNIGSGSGITIVSINYCNTNKKVKSTLEYDSDNGYISFISSSFDLSEIPIAEPINENSNDIITLGDAQNWLFMINPEKYNSKEEYVEDLCKTNFDIIIIDAFFYDDIALTEGDLANLKIKDNGGKRLVIAYLSIGEAEDYRYYWREDYYDNAPEWLLDENDNWAGNYPVKYWNKEWQNIIALGEQSYLHRIIVAGFDGAYLDIVDGYETFEDMMQQ